jgi:glyoxylase-like metal-dependent hydrolase (beta-lactamase superfamily II)
MSRDNNLFQFSLGDFKCIAIRDGGHMGSADFLFVNTPADELNRMLQKHNLDKDQLRSTWTCLLVDTGTVKLLVDTGIGTGEPRGGNLLSQLVRGGIQPNDIDVVFLTHGHLDHLGGCVSEDGEPVFTSAQYMIGKREYHFWMKERRQDDPYFRMAQFARQKLAPIEDRLEFVGADTVVSSGIRTLEAYGHTPGHLGLEIRSQNETLLNLADSVLHPINLVHPEWYSRVDVLPEQMIATRTRLLRLATREQALVLFFHFDFPSLGYVEQNGEHWSWRSK